MRLRIHDDHHARDADHDDDPLTLTFKRNARPRARTKVVSDLGRGSAPLLPRGGTIRAACAARPPMAGRGRGALAYCFSLSSPCRSRAQPPLTTVQHACRARWGRRPRPRRYRGWAPRRRSTQLVRRAERPCRLESCRSRLTPCWHGGFSSVSG